MFVKLLYAKYSISNRAKDCVIKRQTTRWGKEKKENRKRINICNGKKETKMKSKYSKEEN
jgi:hypothetical protein